MGANMQTCSYPVLEALYGQAALRVAVLFDLVNLLVVCILAYSLYHLSPPGKARGDRNHADGGTYDGEWAEDDKILVKQGCVRDVFNSN
jgi:predicted permease